MAQPLGSDRARFNPRLRTGGDGSAWNGIRPSASFNPRLRTGGDSQVKASYPGAKKFQSTPPHGRRQAVAAYFGSESSVSIHASAREATRGAHDADPEVEFQSTPPHGRRRERLERDPAERKFQSTPPHGRRLDASQYMAMPLVFQSTPPHGRRRHTSFGWVPTNKVSIHASAREATASPISVGLILASFNPRLRTGGDPGGHPDILAVQPVSIHASAREATGGRCPAGSQLSVSIHASAREATNGRLTFAFKQGVSIHASAREATPA